MYKAIIPLYIICFGLYIFFSRQPDYFDGEIIPAKIHLIKDSVSNTTIARAFYKINGESFSIPAIPVFSNFSEGETVQLICEASVPSKAAIYRFWGYWMSTGELIASIILPWAFLFFSKAITGNPTPQALLEELDDKPIKKTKYSS